MILLFANLLLSITFPQCHKISGSKFKLEKGEQFRTYGLFGATMINNITSIVNGEEVAVNLVTAGGVVQDVSTISSMKGETTVSLMDPYSIEGLVFTGIGPDAILAQKITGYGDYPNLTYFSLFPTLFFIDSKYDAIITFKATTEETPIIMVNGELTTNVENIAVKAGTSIYLEVQTGTLSISIDMDKEAGEHCPESFIIPDYIKDEKLMFGTGTVKEEALYCPLKNNLNETSKYAIISGPPRISFEVNMDPGSILFFPGNPFEKIVITRKDGLISTILGESMTDPFSIDTGKDTPLKVTVYTTTNSSAISEFTIIGGIDSDADSRIIGTVTTEETFSLDVGQRALVAILDKNKQVFQAELDETLVERTFLVSIDGLLDMWTNILWVVKGIAEGAHFKINNALPVTGTTNPVAKYNIPNYPSMCIIKEDESTLFDIEFKEDTVEPSDIITVDGSNPTYRVIIQGAAKSVEFPSPNSVLFIKQAQKAKAVVFRYKADGERVHMKTFSESDLNEMIIIESGKEEGMVVELEVQNDGVFEGYALYTPDVTHRIVGTIKTMKGFQITGDKIVNVMMRSENGGDYLMNFDNLKITVSDYLNPTRALADEQLVFNEVVVAKAELVSKESAEITATFNIENLQEDDDASYIEYGIPNKLSTAKESDTSLEELEGGGGSPSNLGMIVGIAVGVVAALIIIAVVAFMAVSGKGCFKRKIAGIDENELDNKRKKRGSSEESESSDAELGNLNE